MQISTFLLGAFAASAIAAAIPNPTAAGIAERELPHAGLDVLNEALAAAAHKPAPKKPAPKPKPKHRKPFIINKPSPKKPHFFHPANGPSSLNHGCKDANGIVYNGAVCTETHL